MAVGLCSAAQDPYEILGLQRNAKESDIKRRFQELAKQCHPDRLRGHVSEEARAKATEQFQRVSAAYELLLDSDRRQSLDVRQEADSMTKKWVINESVSLSIMNREDSNEGWWLECRCGGVYIVRQEDLIQTEKQSSVLIECDTCSLVIEVLDCKN